MVVCVGYWEVAYYVSGDVAVVAGWDVYCGLVVVGVEYLAADAADCCACC